MKLFIAFCFVCTLTTSFAIKCDRLECPEGTSTCTTNFHLDYGSKTKTTNTLCIDFNNNTLLKDTYDIVLDDYPEDFPILQCGGHKCPKGSVNCLTTTRFVIGNAGAAYVIQSVCKDFKGKTLDEQVLENSVSPLPFEIVPPPPTCSGFTCPVGSHTCNFEKTIYENPHKVVVVVKCFNLKNQLLVEQVL